MTPPDLEIGPNLYVRVVSITELREQDVNAQIMQPRHFERLTENIRIRGQLESLPYCHQPNGTGPVSIISGHHRVRAARAAGLSEVPCIIDTSDMSRSAIVAKQIAHNELHGSPDADILAQLVGLLDSVDDMLASGLDESALPALDPDNTALQLPRAEFDWRLVTLMFLPSTLEQFRDAVEQIDRSSDLVGIAAREDFESFANTIRSYGVLKDIRSMATVIAVLARTAEREIAAILAEREREAAAAAGLAPASASA